MLLCLRLLIGDQIQTVTLMAKCIKCDNDTYQDRNMCHEHYKEHRRNLHKKRGSSSQWEYKMRNRQRVNLLEWFRRKGISREDLDDKDLNDLVEMKEAIVTAKRKIK
jgi:hypothetical protein